MDKMYIKRGRPVMIGTDYTKQMRFYGYTLREAEKLYREECDLKGARFRKQFVDANFFGCMD